MQLHWNLRSRMLNYSKLAQLNDYVSIIEEENRSLTLIVLQLSKFRIQNRTYRLR